MWYKTAMPERKSHIRTRQTKEITFSNYVCLLFVLSQWAFCSPACWFCTMWMATCKGPIGHYSGKKLKIKKIKLTGCKKNVVKWLACYLHDSLSFTVPAGRSIAVLCPLTGTGPVCPMIHKCLSLGQGDNFNFF